jgi:D-amino-acid dehydrogenase
MSMRVVVLGGGVIGVTTAYELLQDGHEVTLVERAADVALGTSFANAGMVAPGHAFAWASPRAPKILLRSLWRDDQALRFRFHADPAFWRWSLRFLRECTAERARINTQRKHRLCVYSQSVLADMAAQSGVAFDLTQKGLLYFHRSQETFDRGVRNMKILRDLGQAQQILSRDEIAALDPALAPTKDKIAGGIYSSTDATGDCAMFTRGLAEAVRAKGGTIQTKTSAMWLETDGRRLVAVHTDRGRLAADAFVLALGIWSPKLLNGHDRWLPVYPVKGYSLTLPIGGNHVAPSVGAVDEDNLIAYSRLGDRLRVTATADFAGYDAGHHPSDFRVMTKKIQDILPGGADYTRPQYWAGLRPMTPEGTPVLGTGRLQNLYFNTGHGHVGWTMSCGAARVTRDLIAGRKPAIPLEGMTLN